jgi:transcriptional antiterminator
MENKYIVPEIAEILKCSERSVRRYISNHINTTKSGGYEVSESFLNLLKNEYGPIDNEREDMVVQEFTRSEYDEFYKRLSEYPILKKYINTILSELDYHKESARNHQKQMDLILTNMHQRNFIEAKEKKIE